MWVLGAAWFAIILFNLVENWLGMDAQARILMFDVDVEGSIYTWFSELLLAWAGVLLFQIGQEEIGAPRWTQFYWYALGAVFFLLSADEAVGLHERMINPVRNALHTGGALTFAWVIPYGAACVLGLLAIIPFLRALPRRTFVWFMTAAVTYVVGALGMEMVGGMYYQPTGPENPIYRAAATLEEALEGLGALMFLNALLSYRRALRSAA
jgi:hypothetical protein